MLENRLGFVPLVVVMVGLWIAACREIPQPVELLRVAGFVETPGYVRSIFQEDEFLFLANGEAGVTVIATSSPIPPGVGIPPEFYAHWDDPSVEDYARGIWKAPGDTLLYVADTDGGILILRFALDSLGLSYVNSEFGRNLQDITGWVVQDTPYLYVADQDDGLVVYDASYPGFLNLLVTIPLTGYARGVYLDAHAGRLYVAQGQAGLAIFDVATDPAQPALLSNIDLPGDARKVYVQEGIAYVAAREQGLMLVDVSDPSNPSLLSSVDFNGYAWDVVARNDTAWVAAGGDGLQWVDCTDPTSPVVIANLPCDYGYSVRLSGDYVILGGRQGLYWILPNPSGSQKGLP